MLRRARIKALAAVPVRKKPLQDSVDSTDANNVADKERKEENISDINETEQESAKDIAEVKEQKEENVARTDTSEQKEGKEKDGSSTDASEQEKQKEIDVPSTDVPEREAVKDIAKVQKEIRKKKQDRVSLKEKVIVEKPDSQELRSPLKSDRFSDIPDREAVKGIAKEETKKKQDRVNLKELIIVEKPDSQESRSPLKSDRISDIPEGEAVKDIAKVQEETKKKQDRVSLKVIVEKPDFQELCSPLKSDSQELRAQTISQESPVFKPDKVTDQSIQKSIPLPDVPTAIDIASPTKVIQNRPCFMRPTPRLDSGGRIRKNSVQGSASESEDEHSKRVASVVPSRVRNDSVCSVQSNKESAVVDNQSVSPPKIKAMQKRRMLVSESARKLAEARREFLLKHENRTPDRSQLKMYDLIYYNPVTNPMPKSSALERRVITPAPTPPPPEEIPEEEDEDDPSAMPMPQVKVGPDGQLIIDEQSLVIEQTDAKRNEEIMASEATIEDDNSHGGGFYKKHKRSKEWPKWETFKFYRVLNVVGTDFLLMQTLFPNRSRQEIKQKYKKEERVNRQLVEKALKYHQEFDTDMLEEQLAKLQKLECVPNTPKRASEKIKSEQCFSRIYRKRRHRLVAESIGECESMSNEPEADTVDTVTNDELDIEINTDINNVQQQMKRKARKSKKRSDEKSERFDEYSSYTDVDSDSSEEVYQLRPTRSGRLSKKIRKLQAPDFSALNSNTKKESSVDKSVIPSHVAVEVTEYVNTAVTNSGNTETTCSDNIMTMIPNINQMEPGALVIVSKESTESPGNTILQVYMVTSNIDSSTTVTPSVSSGSQSSETLELNQSENVETINVVDDSEK
ncbi:PREDICTED: transcription factor TFIIIB component B'' homolog [Wasmannia auropunctata]|uniref:transcription factor TFIIIB component B'' homolog n=1 Tax=Wasmannia auropunctata TaxID=64793 RepID=UPI0005ED9EDE|nr:PREDICTED: transcription factor TFIIIB component B'' homolog [Wasmannia auropunctata]